MKARTFSGNPYDLDITPWLWLFYRVVEVARIDAHSKNGQLCYEGRTFLEALGLPLEGPLHQMKIYKQKQKRAN